MFRGSMIHTKRTGIANLNASVMKSDGMRMTNMDVRTTTGPVCCKDDIKACVVKTKTQCGQQTCIDEDNRTSFHENKNEALLREE